ncbi:MAG TPA: Ig-like domain repeat protein [Terriglobales bacterium]|nr:Ig-like domain repeat protein [Terriglobales bacterium]
MKRFVLVIASLLSAILIPVQAQVNVTTYHNDNARTGQNTQETLLTPSNVNSTQFGKLFTVSVQGYVYAQPLYLANVQNIAGGTHNVLFVATEHDQLYALDADNGTVLWQQSFINPPNITTVTNSEVSCGDLVPEIGITSTPVIDQSTGTIYLVTKTKETGVYVQRLHAIDIVTHAEKFGGPAVISASVNGQTFDPLRNHNRPGLLLENGHVVIAWASHCDNTPYHGWVMSYKAGVQPTDTLTQEAVFNGSPNGGLAGVWMSGDGVAADASGNIFFATGNGTYDGLTGGDFGDSIMKLGPPSNNVFPIVDWFTPWNQQSLSDADEDLGSGGLLLFPDLPQGSPHQHLLAQMGKEGKIYLIDRDNMGKFCSNCSNIDTQIVQEIPGATTGVWGSPAYWNGSVYWGGGNDGGSADHLKAFSFNANNSGLLSTSPTSQSTKTFSFPTAAPAISANGNSDGIAWLVDNGNGSQALYAYDATNLVNMFYNSTQAPNGRDALSGPVKFTAPIIANGKVYVGSQGSVSAFGLLAQVSATTTVLTSNLSPAYVTQTVTYTAVVSATSGLPTGSVVFKDGTKSVATVALSNGTALYSIAYSKSGGHTIVATYSGDTNDQGSTSNSLRQIVRNLPAKTTTSLITSGTPSKLGQTVTFTATVSSTFGIPPDSETVTFFSGTTEIGTGILSGGSATFSTASLLAGSHTIKATYAGDANFATSTGRVTQVVTKN